MYLDESSTHGLLPWQHCVSLQAAELTAVEACGEERDPSPPLLLLPPPPPLLVLLAAAGITAT